jgi:hypothetical protein
VAFGWPFWAGPERWRAPLAWALLALVLLPHLAWL